MTTYQDEGRAAEERRAALLAKHQRYNSSRKGQARNLRYEAAHPERKERWSPAMRYRAYEPRNLGNQITEEAQREGEWQG